MINLLPATCTPDGQAQFMLTDLTADGYVGGQGYYGNVALGTTDAVAGTDVFLNGARYTQAGRLRLYDATSALPAGAVWQGGMPFSVDGQLCIDTGTVTNATYINGKAVGAKGLYAFAYNEFVATATNLLPAGWTLTRASTGTYFDSAGLLQTAAIDAARGTYRWNGSAWAFDGTIVEAAATTLAIQSNAFTTTWANVNVTSNTQNATGPLGANTAWTGVDSNAGASSTVQYSQVLTAATHTQSIYVKKTSGAQASYPVYYTNTTTRIALATVDTSNGTATIWTAYTGLTVTTSSVTVEDAGTFWRVRLTFLADADAGGWFHALIFAGTTNAAQSTGVIDPSAQGSVVYSAAQLELGSAATSYTATAAASVTRAADVPTAPVSGLLVNGQGFAAVGYRPITAPTTGNIIAATNLPMSLNAGQLSLNDGAAARDFLAAALAVGTAAKLATTWGGVVCNGAFNGTVGTQRVFDGDMGLGATITLMGGVSGVLQSLRLGLTAASSAQLTTFTT